jgi:hypothetical protein
MVILQKQVGNQWVDIADTSELIDGDVYRQSVGGHVNPQGDLVGNGWEQRVYITPPPAGAPVKLIGMGDIAELFPDQVLVDLEDYKTDKNAASVDRRISTRLLARIYANTPIDVLSTSFANYLDSLVSKTALTQEEADSILIALS